MKPIIIVMVTSIALPATARPIDCLIAAKSVIELVATEEGPISEIPVGRGDQVRKGELLVQLDDTLEKLQLELSRARAASDIDIRAQAARLGMRQKEYERIAQLVERSATSRVALDDAEIELSLTKFALEQAQLEQKLAQIELGQAEAMVRRKRLLSPVDGVVLDVEGAPGEHASEQSVMMTIAEIDPLHVEVFAPASLFGQIEEGKFYRVELAAPLSGAYEARVKVVDRVLDSASGTFGIRLEIPNPDGSIPAGARCVVDFEAG